MGPLFHPFLNNMFPEETLKTIPWWALMEHAAATAAQTQRKCPGQSRSREEHPCSSTQAKRRQCPYQRTFPPQEKMDCEEFMANAAAIAKAFFGVDEKNEGTKKETASGSTGPTAPLAEDFNGKEQAKSVQVAQKPIVSNDPDKYEVSLDVSEYDSDEINVKMNENTIIVEGKHETIDENGTSTVSFNRKIQLPTGIQLDLLTCKFVNGKIILSAPYIQPKAVESSERVIPIQVSEKNSDSVEGSESGGSGSKKEDASTPKDVEDNMDTTEKLD